MHSDSHLLWLASWWCGRDIAVSVFEPLLADWRHELDAARTRGLAAYLAVFASGTFGYSRSLVRCTFADGWLPTSRAAQGAVIAFWIAVELAAAVVLLLALQSGRSVDLRGMSTQALLLYSAPTIIAAAMLPALFVLRRDARSTARSAGAVIALGAAITAGAAIVTAPEHINAFFSTFEANEREYQRNLANDRAGRVTYPGTAIREWLGATTIEQRRADYERFMAWRAEQQASAPPLTWPQQLRRMQPVALAFLFGVMGWTLAGLGTVTYPRAAMWWALMYLAMLAFGGLPSALIGIGTATLPHAYAIPLFGVMTLALVVASWRQQDEPQL